MDLPATAPAVLYDPATGRLVERDVAVPRPEGRDLLVAISAVSVNPVDLKLRSGRAAEAGPVRLGFDAAGTVAALGPQAQGFAVGDRVFHAGDATRDGTNGAFQLVDARLVAKAPSGITDGDAAAMPLTALTAWEALFEKMGFAALSEAPQQARLLVVNGAGGVGSVALQLARLSGIHATATASRPETVDWCRDMGADEVVDHAALADQPADSFDGILCAHSTDAYFAQMCRLVAPLGQIVSIVGTHDRHDLSPLFRKSAGFAWEYMFARSLHRAAPERQGAILAQVARLMEEGRLRSTRTLTLQGLTAATLEEAHKIVGAGRQHGKLVVTR